jgi:serine/threonine-protein kinase
VIVGLLDCGGTSEVYLAKDALSTLPVIVKMLTEEAARDMQHRERFILGARSSMILDHPAIGRVYSVEIPPNEPPYLVMEALQGESLAEYLVREKTMSQPMTLTLAREVASGLVAAHTAGIIHRDIKPGNLYLVGPPGSPHCIKIIDFGLSKDLRNVGYGPASVNLVLGTAQYMAPEQVLADPVDERTDIYAFGVVLFGMLTGALPFDLKPGIDLFCQHLFSPAPHPSRLLKDVDPRLEQLILRCLRKHPENRYESMQQLLDELIEIQSHPLVNTDEVSVPVLKRLPDVYIPHSSKGSGVAEDLARHFESEATPLIIPQRRSESEDTLNESAFEVVREPPSTK